MLLKECTIFLSSSTVIIFVQFFLHHLNLFIDVLNLNDSLNVRFFIQHLFNNLIQIISVIEMLVIFRHIFVQNLSFEFCKRELCNFILKIKEKIANLRFLKSGKIV